ncbi:DUF6193 family natural product biosynthesis protein [Streptomyces sp. TLI_171]|uniref:DUF6193 family natural product biosynthesis protein n=1 Tax=Streptomyces sp. TLI_171 TaxID=1938859 RepID=UPI000C198FAD|nr:DUF6193 family natural product biosynthesis protein [Streptomyces sp. TLI_171]RKE23294.1 hypothetical protein BX266_6756 [Streptomyces sp. TLI_171]
MTSPGPDAAAEAAALGAEIARAAAEAGVRLPEPTRLHRRSAEFTGGPQDPSAGQAQLRWWGPVPGVHVTLRRGLATLAQGRTEDLVAAVRATAAWLAGTDLAGTREVAPFLEVRDWAFAHEREPLGRVELRWRVRLQHLDSDLARFPQSARALWEAAFAEPRLRRLFPVTSHHVLWFSSSATLPFERVGGAVDPLHSGAYLVHQRGGETVTVDTAEEAVALVVASLPTVPGGAGP